MNKFINWKLSLVWLFLFILTFILLLIGDTLWFKISLSTIYKPMFTKIQHFPMTFRIWSGILVWLLLALSISIFIIYLSKIESSKINLSSLWVGFFLGFVIYGVYNFTNYSTFKDYTIKTSIIDTLWGTFLLGIIYIISYFIYQFLKPFTLSKI